MSKYTGTNPVNNNQSAYPRQQVSSGSDSSSSYYDSEDEDRRGKEHKFVEIRELDVNSEVMDI